MKVKVKEKGKIIGGAAVHIQKLLSFNSGNQLPLFVELLGLAN